MAGGQPVAAKTAGLVVQKYAHPRHLEDAGQPVDQRAQQCPQVRLRVQAASKFNQRGARVQSLAVENTVDAVLNSAFHRIEDQRGDDDGGRQSPATRRRQSCMDHLSGKRHRAEIDGDERSSGQGISHAALEDKVDVHQPVTDDRVAEGEGQKYQAEHAGLAQQRAGRRPRHQIRNGVEQRKRYDREQRPAR